MIIEDEPPKQEDVKADWALVGSESMEEGRLLLLRFVNETQGVTFTLAKSLS